MKSDNEQRNDDEQRNDNEYRDAFGENVLHVGVGFKEKERQHVLETLSTLGPHLLGRWDPRGIDVEEPGHHPRSLRCKARTDRTA